MFLQPLEILPSLNWKSGTFGSPQHLQPRKKWHASLLWWEACLSSPSQGVFYQLKNKSEISFWGGGHNPGFIVSVFVIHCCVTTNLMVYVLKYTYSLTASVDWESENRFIGSSSQTSPELLRSVCAFRCWLGLSWMHSIMAAWLRPWSLLGRGWSPWASMLDFWGNIEKKGRKRPHWPLTDGIVFISAHSKGQPLSYRKLQHLQEESWPQPPIGAGKGLGMRTLLQL